MSCRMDVLWGGRISILSLQLSSWVTICIVNGQYYFEIFSEQLVLTGLKMLSKQKKNVVNNVLSSRPCCSRIDLALFLRALDFGMVNENWLQLLRSLVPVTPVLLKPGIDFLLNHESGWSSSNRRLFYLHLNLLFHLVIVI